MGCGASSSYAPPEPAPEPEPEAAAPAPGRPPLRSGAGRSGSSSNVNSNVSPMRNFKADEILEQYRFLGKRLGSGVTSRVHLAEDLDRNCLVAIKVIDRRALSRLGRKLSNSGEAAAGDALPRREIAVLKKLRHDNIVRLLDVIDDRQRSLFLVLEYVPSCLTALQPAGEEAAQPLIAGLLDAMSYCHAHGVVHRDIKNGNALVDDDGRTAKLCDFGFATEWRAADSTEITLQAPVGTLPYMAPEMLERKQVILPVPPESMFCSRSPNQG